MQLFFQVLCTFSTSMAIKNSENLDGRPGETFQLGIGRIHCIQNNGYSVFVVISNQTAVSICRKSLNRSEGFLGRLTDLEGRQDSKSFFHIQSYSVFMFLSWVACGSQGIGSCWRNQ